MYPRHENMADYSNFCHICWFLLLMLPTYD